jgi:hypothetical protein
LEQGKLLDEVGQRLATLLTGLFTSRDLQESKARLAEAQRVAQVGYRVWKLDTDRVTGPTTPQSPAKVMTCARWAGVSKYIWIR